MFGNLGADTFDFSAFSASGQTTATADRIAAFSTAQEQMSAYDPKRTRIPIDRSLRTKASP
jgi:hypothetical protein